MSDFSPVDAVMDHYERLAVKEATPAIEAEALRAAADRIEPDILAASTNIMRDWLRDRADRIEAGNA